MPGLPEIAITGTLTRDPELRYTDKGVPVANFIVAANDRRYDANTGKWEDFGATFLRCSIWRGAAENLAESTSKGDRVMVTGVLRQHDYEDAEGNRRTALDVSANEVGVSMKWSVASVRKATRGSTDAAATAADAGTGHAPAEPPF